ncbi:tetratricopeptide repeat protein [Aequorivita sp. Q41]|uniref:tetratricopeptide repeat-containing sensor histidine kinase n=1 Tax=Aequorivita sp. Q41 TaxID=3153300 RepID=UPI0032428E79
MIFPKDNTSHKTYSSEFNFSIKISLGIVCFLFCFAGWGQSEVDSITKVIQEADSPSKKAALYLKRALLFDVRDREKAFADVDSAFKYYKTKDNKIGQTDSYIAYGNLYFKNRNPKQAAHYDSLAIQLATTIKYEKGTSVSLGNLGREFITVGEFKLAEKLIKDAIVQEEKFKSLDKDRLAELYNRHCIITTSLGDIVGSLPIIEKAMELAENSTNTHLLTQIYTNYANTLSRLSKFDEAVEVHYKVIRLSEKTNDTTGLLRAYNNLGIVFRNGEEFDKAITYYKKSMSLAKKAKNYKSLGLSTVNLATVYSGKGQYEAMDTLYSQGIHYFKLASDKGGIAFANHNYGNFLLLSEKYTEADKHLKIAYQLRTEIGAKRQAASTLAVLGKSAISQKKWKEAEKYLKDAEVVFNDTEHDDRNLKELYGYLKELYTEKEDYKQAFYYQTEELALEKSLFTANEKVNTLKLETQYELEKRDLALAIEKEKQRRSKQRILFISVGVVLLLLISLLFLWFRRRQLKERHKAQIQSLDQEHRLNISKTLKNAEQEERKKIAHKLHDEAGSMLSIAILNVKQLQDDIFKAGGGAEEKLETTKKILVDISDSVRNISHTLMPIALEKYGLKAAIHDLVHAVNTSKSIKIEEIIEGLDSTSTWSEEFCLTVYRIVQEVTNNIIKHAQATHVLLQVVELEDSVTIYIEDDGKGIDEATNKDGIGLKLLKNNVAYLNGTIEISGSQNSGTFILAELPILKTN